MVFAPLAMPWNSLPALLLADYRQRQQGRAQARPYRSILLPFLNCLRQLKRLDVCCLPAFRPLNDVELHSLAFLQTLEAIRVNGGVMHEDVFSVLAGDEAVALGVVKPLHSTLFHLMLIPGVNCAGANRSLTDSVMHLGQDDFRPVLN